MSGIDNTPERCRPPAVEVAAPVLPASVRCRLHPRCSERCRRHPAWSPWLRSAAVRRMFCRGGGPAESATTEPAKAPQLKMSHRRLLAGCQGCQRQDPVQRSGRRRTTSLCWKDPSHSNSSLAPMAVNLEYQGKSFDMSRYNNGRTARFTCRRSNQSAMSVHKSPQSRITHRSSQIQADHGRQRTGRGRCPHHGADHDQHQDHGRGRHRRADPADRAGVGADIVRVSVPTMEAAEAFRLIKQQTRIPSSPTSTSTTASP